MLRTFLMLWALSPGNAFTPLALQSAHISAAEELEEHALPPPSTCVTFQGRVRYSLGYDHLVDVQNGCTQAVSCAVTTNVNPQPVTVNLKPTESATVVTFIGSPAREFTPRVVCQYSP